MVDSISGNGAYYGKTGDLGSDFDVQWSRYKIKSRELGYTDFKSSLFMGGVDGDAVLQDVEDHIEGNDYNGNGVDGDLLSWDKYLESDNKKNDLLFASKDDKTFTNVNFNTDSYKVMDEKGFTEALDMDWGNGKPYDAYEITQNNINFYDFIFGGTSGGQTNRTYDLTDCDNARWGLQSFTQRTVDTSYWGKAANPSDQQSVLANDTLRIIKQSMPQWMTNEIKQQLSNYPEGSVDYWNKFYQLAIQLMDQEGYTKGTTKS